VRAELPGRESTVKWQSSPESCRVARRTDTAVLEDRQLVKTKCEDSASVIVNCSEL
jgi:hypothetical protein